MKQITLVDGAKFPVPCPHTAQGVDNGTLSDYQPLTLREVTQLVELAREQPSLANKVQGRLIQAIVGMTCPRPGDGKPSRDLAEMESLFVKQIEGTRPAFDLGTELFSFMR